MKLRVKNIQSSNKIKTYEDYLKTYVDNYQEYMVVIEDGVVTSLNSKINDGSNVVFFTNTTRVGSNVHANTLKLIFLKAFHTIYPNSQVYLNHYLGGGLYIDFEEDFSLSLNDVKAIEHQMKLIIKQDLQITYKYIDKTDANEIFYKFNREAISLIESTNVNTIKVACIDDYIDINYEILAPSSGYINNFKLMQYYPGILLISPNMQNEFDPNNYKEMPKLAKVYQESTDRYRDIDLFTLSNVNERITRNKAKELVDVCEAVFDKQLMETASDIADERDLKLILISGPSSSGKTTFTYRLKILLLSMGLKPITIGMDDYFLDRKYTPRLDNGKYDYESPDAVDLELLNRDLYSLLNGESILRKEFDFIDGRSITTDSILKPSPRSIFIMEGIHALNPIVSEFIPEKNKYKIYISALSQVELDSHNRISSSDTRFIRRAIRDNRYRGSNIENTFDMWKNVRIGEHKYIYPFQETADTLINTALPYELSVLKKHIVPLLESVRDHSPHINYINKLLDILQFVKSIDDDSLISSESLLREFIGRWQHQGVNLL